MKLTSSISGRSWPAPSILVDGWLASTSAAWLLRRAVQAGEPCTETRPVDGQTDGCVWGFSFKRRGEVSERASEPGCSRVMDSCLSSPPPGCPPPSGRDWSGALHHICLRGSILQQLMRDRTTAAAAASGSYMMSASVWVYTGTIFFPPFRFVTK